MMYPINQLKDIKKPRTYKDREGNKHSDTIYCFDIETTSLFYINGKWQRFDYSIPQRSDKKNNIIGYDNIPKAGVCWFCQFSVNDTVYYFREISDFENVLKKISNPFLKKYIFIHNLSFEMQWLLPILRKYTIIDLVAREIRKPISFTIKELNIEFRCSYMLTNLSLEKSAKNYTDVQKASGDLDYSIERSPMTTNLTEKELYYCEMDCVCLYHIIKFFRSKYGHIKKIPLTQTGELRRAYRDVVPFEHYEMVKSLVPSLEEYKILNGAFMGGIVHGNALHVGQYLTNIDSVDISSSYPYAMISELYPIERFVKIKNSNNKYYPNDKYAKIYVLKLKNVKSKMYNHYLSLSHCNNVIKPVIDNGRIVCAKSLELVLTDIDFELLQKCYSFDSEIIEIWTARKDYLPRYLIDFILMNYGNKTKLKGQTSADGLIESLYMKSKQYTNSIYGAMVTNLISASCIFDKEWIQSPITDDFIQLKLDEEKTRYGLFVYSQGVWVTAYARRNLFERLIDYDYELDFDVVYYDTDSLKILNFDKHKHIFERYNKEVVKKLWKMCVVRDIDFNKCCPCDIEGNKHLIGEFDINDGHYSQFVTLGAKRYCYRDKLDSKLHMTVSGVSKGAVVSLNNDIANFNKNTVFDYKSARKNIVAYNDKQQPFTFIDCEGNYYSCDWESSIVIYPTSYVMSMDSTFEDFINYLMFYATIDKDKQNDFIPRYKALNTKKG